jgi:hypothetical protein
MAEDPRPTPNFLYEVARHQLDVQLDFVDGVDSKLGMLFAAGSAETGIAAAFLVLKPDFIRGEAGFLVFGVLAYLALTVTSVAGLWHREWRVGLKAEELARLYFNGFSEEDVKRQATRRLISQWNINQIQYRAKSRWLRLALVAMATLTAVALLAVGQLAVFGRPPS